MVLLQVVLEVVVQVKVRMLSVILIQVLQEQLTPYFQLVLVDLEEKVSVILGNIVVQPVMELVVTVM